MTGRLLIAAALLGMSTVAAAQSETGTRIGGRPAQVPNHGSSTERGRIWLQGYAACVAKRDPKRVAAVLDADPMVDAPAYKVVEGNYEQCLSSGGEADALVMTDRLLRGALYAERVSKMVHKLTPEMLPVNLLTFAASNPSDTAKARVSVIRFGECVVRQNPSAALSFVAADAGNAGEDNALKALMPSLSPCFDAGTKVELSRSGLEAALAEAIYRTVRAARNAGAQ